MIGTTVERRQDWGLAAGLSVALHLGIAAYALGLFPSVAPRAVPPAPLPDIQITSLTLDPGGNEVDGGTEAPDVAVLPAIADPPDAPVPTIPAQGLTPTPTTLEPVGPQVLTPLAPGQIAALPTVTPPGATVPPAPADAPTAPEGVIPGSPQEQALADMLRRIRAHVGDACVLALPQRQEDGGLGMTVLSDSDRGIAAMVDEVTQGLGADVQTRSVLVDPRQCAAVAFLRARPTYPAFGLALGSETAQVPSGGRLRGEVRNMANQSLSLFLVDSNGVVQDMRRFMTFTGGRATFDIPVRNAGPARDTGQLLIAVATPGRPSSIAANIDRLAEEFFPPVAAEVGQDAMVGVLTFGVQ